jgi:hypothetical protein
MPTINVQDIELAVVRWFGARANLCVPNVSWGLGLHECDLLIASTSGYLTEIEIKVSRSDLIKDMGKRHGHRSNKIKYLYFAVPPKLLKAIEYIPRRAGILVYTSKGFIKEIAEPERNPDARKISDAERYTMARLGALRIWGLIYENQNLRNEIKRMKEAEHETTNI